jgi:hypothetical protein
MAYGKQEIRLSSGRCLVLKEWACGHRIYILEKGGFKIQGTRKNSRRRKAWQE